MTEKSYFWTTGGAGDGAATYTRTDHARAMLAVGRGNGVTPSLLNECSAAVGGANTVNVNTGGAVVDGIPYYNDAIVAVTIPSAVGTGNTRIDRIVLRANWTAQTVRVTRIAGTDAASPTAPNITTTSGSTYDVLLYRATVNTSGTVTLTDERGFRQLGDTGLATAAVTSGKLATDAVIEAKIAANAVSTAKIADSAVTAAKIANRTRKLFVPATGGITSPSTAVTRVVSGFTLSATTSGYTYGEFVIPNDYVSTLTITPVLVSTPTNTVVLSLEAVTASNNVTTADTTVALANGLNQVLTTALDSLTAGEYCTLKLTRNGAAAADTGGTGVWTTGWIISYTADS